MKDIDEEKIINLILKKPELLLTMSSDKLTAILDMLEKKNKEYDKKIDKLEKELKIKK